MSQARSHTAWRPKLGIVAHAPIQYHTPLFQLLAKRNNIDLDVLFLSDRGVTAFIDQQFGLAVAWDIDLLSGYAHNFLTTDRNPSSIIKRLRMLADWVPSHNAVVVNGYTIPWILLTMAICRIRGVPYLLRGSSHPQGESPGFRRYLRWVVTRLVVAGSSGVLSMGRLNDEFYRRTHARDHLRAGRRDVHIIGAKRQVDPAWLLRREVARPTSGRRIALNNVSFVSPGGERWALLRNPLDFLTENEKAALDPGRCAGNQRRASVVHLTARRADVLAVPSTGMAERVTRILPGLADRVVMRHHPVSADSIPRLPREPGILCPVLFSPHKACWSGSPSCSPPSTTSPIRRCGYA